MKADYSKINQIQNRKQIIYEFTDIENNKLENLAKKHNLDSKTMINICLTRALAKFYKNKLVLINNNDNNFIIPLENVNSNDIENIINNMKMFSESKLCQKFMLGLMFSYLNNLKYNNLYPPYFIQIDGIKINNKLNIELFKYNLKCEINAFPIQINYYIIDNRINLTISSESEHEIVKYIIPEMMKLID